MSGAGPLAIVSAIAQEQSGLLAALQAQRIVRHGARQYVRGRLWGHEVVLVLSGIGKVAAASTATSLIDTFGCSALLFTGVAGGLGDGVRVGDVVIASELLQHDLDARPLYPRFEVPDTGRARFAADARLSQALAVAAQQVLAGAAPIDASTRAEFALHAPKVHSGLIVSGDQFIASAQASAALRAAVPDALAVEMEGAALAQVCHDHSRPFALMRTISDRADDAAHHDFPRFIDRVASAYSYALVRALLGGGLLPSAR